MHHDDTPDNGAPPPRLVIERGLATIEHLNIRKVGDDKSELATDIKVAFSKLPATVLDYFDPLLRGFLWTEDEQGGLFVRSPMMQPIAFANEVTAEVRIADMEWFAGKAKKFAVSPVDGGVVDMTCSVSVSPTASEVARLAKLVQDGAFVSIAQPEDLFSVGGGAS